MAPRRPYTTGEAELAPIVRRASWTQRAELNGFFSAGFPEFYSRILMGGTLRYCIVSQEKKKVPAVVCEAKEGVHSLFH